MIEELFTLLSTWNCQALIQSGAMDEKGVDPFRNMLSPIVGPTFKHLAPHTHDHPANCQIVGKIPEGKLVFQAKKMPFQPTINQSISFFFVA